MQSHALFSLLPLIFLTDEYKTRTLNLSLFVLYLSLVIDMDSAGSSRSFGFGSDDVLCAYDEFNGQDLGNGKRLDPSGKDFHEGRMGRLLVNVPEQQDVYPKEEVITAVEKCMKKYADNLLRHLEGISGRLSQLEIYCYKLERSMGEFRADVIRDQSESDTKLKSLEKHLQEVHRSIQIIRDTQELAETQRELAKFQLTSKEAPNPTQSQIGEEAPVSSTIPEPNAPNPHLALALHQIPPTASLGPPHDRYVFSQSAPLYPTQSQSLPSELHYIHIRPQIQDPSIQAPPPPQLLPQYQQQWTQISPQQLTQQVVMPAQQPTSHAQLMRPRTPPTYTSVNPESFQYLTISQPAGTLVETVPVSYGISGQPQHSASVTQSSRGPPVAKPGGYVSSAPYPSQSNGQGYSTIYNVDGARVQTHQSGSYAPPNPQVLRSNPYADMIEKAMSIGYPRDHVVSIFNRMVESGQSVDFNALLDRLNARPASGGATHA